MGWSKTIYDGQGRAVGIACGRGGEPCDTPGCHSYSEYLCDFPLSGEKQGKTCDRRMCGRHRNNVGREKDYCAPHFAQHERKLKEEACKSV